MTYCSTKVLTQPFLIEFQDLRSACDVIVSYLLWPTNTSSLKMAEGMLVAKDNIKSSFCLTRNAAPAVNDTLTPDDAVDVLEELLPAQNKSYELGLKLKLRQYEVDSIHSTYSKPRSRLLHVLIEFTNQTEPRPTWKVIVQALRSPAVNLPALARRVEAAHFPDPTAKRDVVAETTGMSPSAPLISDWCSHVSNISDTESAVNSTAGNDDEVKSKTLSHPSPTTGVHITAIYSYFLLPAWL